MKQASKLPRFVWCVFDGLRRDMISVDGTPNLHALLAHGVDFPSSRSVFPSVTRVNTTAMACGAIPAATGVIANKLFDPGVFEDRILHTGLFDHIAAAERAYNGHFVEVAALGDMLAGHGLSVAVVSTGSAGTTHLLNPRASSLKQVTLCLTDWRASTPSDYAQHILDRFGPIPPNAKPNIERMTRQMDMALNAVIPDIQPDVLIIWFTDPDATYHRFGLGSPESLAAIHHADAQLGRLMARRDASPDGENCQIIVCSDHGQITARERIDIRQEARTAGMEIAASATGHETFVGNIDYCGTIRVAPNDTRDLHRMVAWLMEQPWCAAIFTTTDRGTSGLVPGTFSLALAGIHHKRAPQIYYTMVADDRPNAWGLPGSCYFDSTDIAPGGGIHGGLHKIEMNNFLGLNGAKFKDNYVSRWPASHTDIVPTILHSFGIEIPASVTGRVLTEALAKGDVPPEAESYTISTQTHGRSQHLALWRVGHSTYVNEGWVEGV